MRRRLAGGCWWTWRRWAPHESRWGCRAVSRGARGCGSDRDRGARGRGGGSDVIPAAVHAGVEAACARGRGARRLVAARGGVSVLPVAVIGGGAGDVILSARWLAALQARGDQVELYMRRPALERLLRPLVARIRRTAPPVDLPRVDEAT